MFFFEFLMIICTPDGRSVSFWETLPVHVSQNGILFRIHNLNAELWPTRVHCALLLVCMCHSGRHCLCMYPRMRQFIAIRIRLQNFDRQECIVHSCLSSTMILRENTLLTLFKILISLFNIYLLFFVLYIPYGMYWTIL